MRLLGYRSGCRGHRRLGDRRLSSDHPRGNAVRRATTHDSTRPRPRPRTESPPAPLPPRTRTSQSTPCTSKPTCARSSMVKAFCSSSLLFDVLANNGELSDQVITSNSASFTDNVTVTPVLCTRFYEPVTTNQLLCTRYGVLGTRFQVLCTSFREQYKYQACEIRLLVPCLYSRVTTIDNYNR